MAQGGSGSLEEHAVDHHTDVASGPKMVVFEATRRGTMRAMHAMHSLLACPVFFFSLLFWLYGVQ